MKRKNICQTCQRLTIDTLSLGKICKYHKRAGQSYSGQQIINGFCPHAFFVAYPYCLSLLYNGTIQSFDLSCPVGAVQFRVTRINCWNLAAKISLQLVKRVSRSFLPLDIEDWHIQMEVRKVGECPLKLARRNKYYFNIRQLDYLCPASFYTLYPFFINKNNTGLLLACPDHQGMIYKIKIK